MELFHTSPSEIKAITANGRFGEFLFFSSHVYQMAAGDALTYSIEIDADQIIEASQLFYHDEAAKLESLVAELARRLAVSEEDAEALIEESKSVFDIDFIEAEDAAEVSWDVQHFTARAAKILGFRGVAVEDEQGTAYLIDMLGQESALNAA